jgi:hypothetical protein
MNSPLLNTDPGPFPICVLAIDSGEVTRYETLADVRGHLEAIDVENHEYLAWQASGAALVLTSDERGLISVASAPTTAQPDLLDALLRYAAATGLKDTPESLRELDTNSLLQRIQAHIERNRHDKSILRQFIRKLRGMTSERHAGI